MSKTVTTIKNRIPYFRFKQVITKYRNLEKKYNELLSQNIDKRQTQD